MSRTPLFALVRKDLRLFLSDRRAVMITVVTPVLLASFMAIVMGGGGSDDGAPTRSKIPVFVVDRDGGPITASIVKAVGDDKAIAIERIPTAEAARERVLKGDAAVAVVFPEGFGKSASRSLFRGGDGKPTLLVLADPAHGAEAAMVRGLMMQHVMQNVTREAFTGRSGEAMIDDALGEIDRSQSMSAADRLALRTMLSGVKGWYGRLAETKDAGDATPAAGQPGISVPFETREEVVTARKVGNDDASQRTERQRAMYAHAFAGMAVQFVLFGAIEAGVGILTERQRGLWKRLRAAPLARSTLLVAKSISGAMISLLSIAVVFLFGWMMFGVRIEGNPLGFVLVAVSFALCASALGLLIAALGKTPGAARGVSVLVVLVMVMLGGAWVPMFLFPAWLQGITFALPTRWGVDGFEAMTFRGQGLASALTISGALLGFAALFGTIAAMRFRWESE